MRRDRIRTTNLKILILFVSLLTLPACVTKVSTIEERIDLLAPGYELAFPDAKPPYPFVLFFHGCGGLFGNEGKKNVLPEYRTIALEEGYAVLTVDSFTPRGIGFDQAIGRVCRGLELRGRKRAGDVIASLTLAGRLSIATDSGFVLAGWSHGGWTIMEAMIMDLQTDYPPDLEKTGRDVFAPVSGVYLTYPYCGFPSRARRLGWARAVPTSVVVAENDTLAKAQDCNKAFEKMRRSGVEIDIEVFEGVTHAFDESDHIEGSRLIYDPAAAAKAHERFRGYLRSMIEKTELEEF